MEEGGRKEEGGMVDNGGKRTDEDGARRRTMEEVRCSRVDEGRNGTKEDRGKMN